LVDTQEPEAEVLGGREARGKRPEYTEVADHKVLWERVGLGLGLLELEERVGARLRGVVLALGDVEVEAVLLQQKGRYVSG
jgi:hypothetical protein